MHHIYSECLTGKMFGRIPQTNARCFRAEPEDGFLPENTLHSTKTDRYQKLA